MYKILIISIIFSSPVMLWAQTNDTVTSPQKFEVPLNNGEKWNTNQVTVQAIENMQRMVSRASKKNMDPAELAYALSEEYKAIFTHCDIKGQGHDYLHEYLSVIGTLIPQIEKGDEASRLHLQRYLMVFNQYFQ